MQTISVLPLPGLVHNEVFFGGLRDNALGWLEWLRHLFLHSFKGRWWLVSDACTSFLLLVNVTLTHSISSIAAALVNSRLNLEGD